MTERHDLYLARSASITDTAALVLTVTGIWLAARHSSYWGGDYYLWQGDGHAELRVCENVPDQDGEMLEPDFPDARILLYASALPSSMFDLLAGSDRFALLRSHQL